jgi:uncharacterized protein (TIGR03118 family)
MFRFDSRSWRRRSRFHAKRQRQRPTVDCLEERRLMASSLTTFSVPISPAPVEGASFTSVVARFTDADKNTDPNQYSATINWGDGHTSTGSVAVDPKPNNGFDVSGTHTFAEEGSFPVSVQITDKDGDSGSVQTTNIVADAPLSASGVTINATSDLELNDAVVATFTDANPAGKASEFTATIDWGDGLTSEGHVVSDKNGGFDVLGSHHYSVAGAFAVHVQIQDGGEHVLATQFYTPTSLISDGTVPADHTDANLLNPWGLAAGMTPIWISDNNAGVSTLTDGSGNPVKLVVTIPTPPGGTPPAAPTGTVFNGNPAEFLINGMGTAAHFIFATEDGTVAAWNGGPSAVLKIDHSTFGAVYKGVTIATVGSSDFLYVTNFNSGQVEVYDSTFTPHTFSVTQFTDPNLPAGYAPFGIQAIGGSIYVTYALQNAQKHDDVAGPGNGFVDQYSPSGVLMQRLGGPGVQPELNSPWGVVLAPSNFGKFSNDLLVGNFEDSHISAFDPTSGAFLGQLADAQGHPLSLLGGFKGTSTKGLWGLRFGNGGAAGPTNTLFFASGINDEKDGLFGAITANSVSTASASSVVGVSEEQGHAPAKPGDDDADSGDDMGTHENMDTKSTLAEPVAPATPAVPATSGDQGSEPSLPSVFTAGTVIPQNDPGSQHGHHAKLGADASFVKKSQHGHVHARALLRADHNG